MLTKKQEQVLKELIRMLAKLADQLSGMEYSKVVFKELREVGIELDESLLNK